MFELILMDFFPFYRIILLINPFRPCGGLSNVNLIHHYIGSTATIKKHNNELSQTNYMGYIGAYDIVTMHIDYRVMK